MEDVPCTYRISVKAIIKNDKGAILLIREKDGSWEFPGGGLDHGENPVERLKREIAEELGCKVSSIANTPSSFWIIRKEVGSSTLKWFAFVAYEAKISDEIKSNQTNADGMEVIEEVGYFTAEEAKKLKLHDNIKAYFLS